MLSQRERRSDACDVVVVGAGLTGAAIAASLARQGCRTAVLEARRVGGGATGRSLGVAIPGLMVPYSRAVSIYGRERAREIWALTTRGRARVVETARELRVPFRRTGTLALAVDDDEADELWESVKLLRQDGFDASFTLTDPLGRGFHGALRRFDDVVIRPSELTRALLDAEDIVVHEGTEVRALESRRDGVRVSAHGRTVVCDKVVLAVNGYAALVHPHLAHKVAPVPTFVLTIDPVDSPFMDPPCTFHHGRAILRSLPDGRLLLGVRQPDGVLSGQELLKGQTMEFVSRHFPDLDLTSIERSSEVTGMTGDGLPLVGQLPSLPEVYFAVGFGGRGLSWAFVVAERLVDAMLHDAEPSLLSADRVSVA